MANEDPDSIPEQLRQNRPFFMVFALAIVIAVGAFLFVLFSDAEENDVGRNMPPEPAEAAAPAAEAAAPEAAAPATEAPAAGAAAPAPAADAPAPATN